MNQGVEIKKNMKQFYITELHFGDDGLESYTDYSGPHTLRKASSIILVREKSQDPTIRVPTKSEVILQLV